MSLLRPRLSETRGEVKQLFQKPYAFFKFIFLEIGAIPASAETALFSFALQLHNLLPMLSLKPHLPER